MNVFKIILLLMLLILAFSFKVEILNFAIQISEYENNYVFLIIIFFLFFVPFISTFLILANSVFFYENSFYISYFFLIISSIVTFLVVEKFKNKILLKIKFKNRLDDVFKKTNKFYNSDYIIFLSRYIIPPFVHNFSYGLIKNIKFSKFLIMISFAELPVVFTLNLIGKSLQSFDNIKNSSINILFEPSFYLPTIFLFLIIITVKLIVKNIKK